ncbi:sodium-dependent phosphate transporter [Halorhodospira halochloris]|uniref:Sodium-dependent phosphate transporter n=2 Tax=Halorhodospira halochloris TaxID=1052 RepID=A0A0X8XBG1_HALHR|nr:sodium-dependent phosphate transporter [Halorhodospira halochloris]
MGSGLGTFGEESDFLIRAFEYGKNPFIAFLGAVLVTAIVQSSSFTSALIVTLVATGEMTLGTAVFAIMGANIGTSVTALIVALANIRIRRNFRRSFTAALLHDFFNILTVLVIFPLEWITSIFHEQGRGIVTQAAAGVADLIGLPEVARPNDPVSVATAPLVNFVDGAGAMFMPTSMAQGIFVGIAGLIIMLISLIMMVKNLRGALLRYMDGLFRTYFFRTDPRSYGIGILSTVMVQSSTITTSLMVPLAGAGVVPMKRVFPFMMGSNLGTTVTSVIAATANPVAAAMTVAMFHVLFNLTGSLIWYPLRWVPIKIASWYGRLAGRKPSYAFLFLFLLFVVTPLVGLTLTELLVIHR